MNSPRRLRHTSGRVRRHSIAGQVLSPSATHDTSAVRSRRWSLPVLLLICAVCAVVLYAAVAPAAYFPLLKATEFRLTARVGLLQYRMMKSQRLESLSAQHLRITGVRYAELRSMHRKPLNIALDTVKGMLVRPLGTSDSGSVIHVSDIELPIHSLISLRTEKVGNALIITINNMQKPFVMQSDLTCVATIGAAGDTLEIQSGDLLYFAAGAFDRTTLRIKHERPMEIGSALAIDSLWFAVTDSPIDAFAVTSTILSGSLMIHSLNGRQYELKSGEWLRLRDCHGVITTVEQDSDAVKFEFAGSATRIQVGTMSNPLELSPTVLEYLAARKPLILAISVLTAVIGYFAGFFRNAR